MCDCQNRKFRVISSIGNHHTFFMNGYDSNVILVWPLKSANAIDLIVSIKEACESLSKRMQAESLNFRQQGLIKI